ncbi:MAG TPA: flagellar hook-associated protein FlgK [Acidimicrobiales bacterium]|nr:flagellar hook-associated protein FlgK [Acidimicrobiales bacterium]
MGDLALSIAASGLDAQQTTMDTISQNLANADTPGYVQESADLTTIPGGDSLGVGGGVSVSAISQASDQLQLANAQQAQGTLAQSTALQQVLSGAQAAFPEPGANGLSAQLASFWQAWDAIAQNPTSLAARTQVVDLAQNITTTLGQASGQLTQLASNAQSQLGTIVSGTNTLLSQVAELNNQIVEAKGAGANPNALIDQRNQLLSTLATDVGAVSRDMGDGTVMVSVGGVALVQGSFADTLKLTGTAGSMQLTSAASGVALSATGGSAAGLLGAINQYLPSYQANLDTVANALASTVNGQLAAGYTATGASGAADPLFTGSGAAGLEVNAAVVANPQLIAASSTSTLPDATNDGANAQAMAELFDTATGPDQAYQSFIQTLGAQVQSTDTQVQANTSVANAAQENLQAVAGVNPDQQMIQMLSTQQAFQASAKLISTVSTMMQSLMAAV